MRQRLVTEKWMRVTNAELGRIQHYQHLGCQRLGRRLACFAANQTGHRIPLLAKQLLKSLQHGNSITYASGLPRQLRSFGSKHSVLYIAGGCRR